ncbi:PEP-CTERM sorting domain-containing protein [Scleromatobacter humisilvae]|uniref:PEP-CTERM sorting domain-containing protein n=1 Tax=Scleromatobacter humisilvae TaxID=2897159 RepID=A0A9X2C110_9BURK|nr:PEP-CTERM sorting domain-containing protein [Scleromatobacter humisilvae]MCK9687106.1 PEP-CTERM sorting domain-containing protein [Scleromatobacter humisilvae]
MKKIITLAALAAVSATASAAGNLLVDGSFESIAQPAGTWNTYTSVPGWVVTKANGTATSTGLEIRDNIAGTAENGHNFVELDGYENDKITQSFATTIGKDYEISFWFADRAGVAPGSLGFLATVVSGSGVSATGFGAVGDNGAAWHLITMDFTAESASSVFSIKATGTSDGYGTSFDNFQAVAVPEPASLGLFAAGMAVLGFTARRRRVQ